MSQIEELLKWLMDRSVIRVLRYIDARVHPPAEPYDEVINTVKRRAVATSADYIEAHLDDVLILPARVDVWNYALSRTTIDGLYAEFGVFRGESINHMASVLQARNLTIYGFDSFEGLKEDWRGTWYRAGHFSLQGQLPKVLPNVTLIKGWFDATVPPFLAAHPNQPFAFLHLDADTFESTTQLLALLKDRIVPGTVIIFDEYIGFTNWQRGEFLAWRNFVEANNLQYRYLAFSNTPTALQVV